MTSHTELVYVTEGENKETGRNIEKASDIIQNHLKNDVESIQPIFDEERNTMHIMRYLSSILEEDTSSTRIICPDPTRINLLERNLHSLPEKEVWHLVLKLIQSVNGSLENLIRTYIEDRNIAPEILVRYSSLRNLLWSLVVGTGCQFCQTKRSTSRKRFNKSRPVLSATEGTSRFMCLPMAQKCHLIHPNFVGGSRQMTLDKVTDYGVFMKDTDVLEDELRDTYNNFYLDLGETLTLNWIEWLTNMSSLKKESRFIQTLCMVTFYHLVTYFIEIGFERDGELHKLLELPFHLSLADWSSIFSTFVFEEEDQSYTCPDKFLYFIECFGKWKKNHEAKQTTRTISTDWYDLIRSCLAFVHNSPEMKKKKNDRLWTDARDLFGKNEIYNWKLRRGFPLPIDCSHIKFEDVRSDIFCWSSFESHFVAIVFMALGCIAAEPKVNIEELFKKEIDLMKDIYSNSDKQELKEMHQEIYVMDPMKAANAMNAMKELHVDHAAIAKKMNLPPAYEEAESIISLQTVYGSHSSRGGDERQRTFENTLKLIREMFDREENIQNITRIAKESMTTLNNKYPLPHSLYCDSAVAKTDNIDVTSSAIYPDDAPTNLLPQSVYGDGNCLFRSFSLLCFGSEDKHIEMRCRAVLELLCNADFYLSTEMLANEKNKMSTLGIISAICVSDKFQQKKVMEGFIDSIRQSTIISNWDSVSFWHVTALASVCKRRVRSIYPATQVKISYKSKLRYLLNRLILPNMQNESEEKQNILYIMWTNIHLTDKRKAWRPNHFVPCLPDRLGEEPEQFDEYGLPTSGTEQLESKDVDEDVVELSSEEEDEYEDGQRMTETPYSDHEIYFGATLEDMPVVDTNEDIITEREGDKGRNDESLLGEKIFTLEEEEGTGTFDENKYGGCTQIPQIMSPDNTSEDENFFEQPNSLDMTNQSERTIIYYDDEKDKTLTTPNTSIDVDQSNLKQHAMNPMSRISKEASQSHLLLTPSKIKRCLSNLEDDLENEKESTEIDEHNDTLISLTEWRRRVKRQNEQVEETCDEENSEKSEDDEIQGENRQPDNTFIDDANESQEKNLYDNRQQQTFDYTPETLSDNEMDENLSMSLLNETIHFSPIPKRKLSDEEEDSEPDTPKTKTLSTSMTSTPKKAHGPLPFEASVRKKLFKKVKTVQELSTKQERTAEFVKCTTPSIETVEAMRQNNETLLHSIQEEKDKNMQLTNQLTLLQQDNEMLSLTKLKESEENESKDRKTRKVIEDLEKRKQSVTLEHNKLLDQMSQMEKMIQEREASAFNKFAEMEKMLNELKHKREIEQTQLAHRIEEQILEKNQVLSKLTETIQEKNDIKQEADEFIREMKQEHDERISEKATLIKSTEEVQQKNLEQLQELEKEKKSFMSQLAKCVDQSNHQTKLLEEKDELIHHLQLNSSVENNQFVELMDTKHTHETTIQTLEMEKCALAHALQEKEFELQDKIKLAHRQISLANDEFVAEMTQMKKNMETQLENERSKAKKNEEISKNRMETRLNEVSEKLEGEKQLKCKVEREMLRLKREVSENEVHMKENNEQVKKLKDDIRQLKGESHQLETAKDEICLIKSQLTSIEKEKKDGEELILKKEKMIKELEQKLTQVTNDDKDEYSSLREQLSKVNIKKDRYFKELEKTKDDLRTLKGTTEESSSSLTIERDMLKGKIKSQENDIAKVRAQLKDTTQDMKDEKNSLQPLKEQNDNLKAEKDHLIHELDKRSQMITRLEECVRQRPKRRIITKIGQTQTETSKLNKCNEMTELKDHVHEEINNITEEFTKRLGKHYIKGTLSKCEKEVGDIAEMLHSQWNFFIRNIEDFRCKKDMDEKFGTYVKSVLCDIKSIMKSMQVREENVSDSDHLKAQLNESSKQLEKKDEELTMTKQVLNTSEIEKVKLADLVDGKLNKIQKLSSENQSLHDENEYMKNEMHQLKDDTAERERESKKKLSSVKAECSRLEWQIETLKKTMHRQDEKLVEKNNNIAKLEWTANQKQKKFSLLKDQVTTLSKLGATDGISKDLISLSGRFKWMRKALVSFS